MSKTVICDKFSDPSTPQAKKKSKELNEAILKIRESMEKKYGDQKQANKR